MAIHLDIGEAVNAIVHFWYSAAIDVNTLDAVKKIGIQIRSICDTQVLATQKEHSVASLRFGRVDVALLVSQWKWILN